MSRSLTRPRKQSLGYSNNSNNASINKHPRSSSLTCSMTSTEEMSDFSNSYYSDISMSEDGDYDDDDDDDQALDAILPPTVSSSSSRNNKKGLLSKLDQLLLNHGGANRRKSMDSSTGGSVKSRGSRNSQGSRRSKGSSKKKSQKTQPRRFSALPGSVLKRNDKSLLPPKDNPKNDEDNTHQEGATGDFNTKQRRRHSTNSVSSDDDDDYEQDYCDYHGARSSIRNSASSSSSGMEESLQAYHQIISDFADDCSLGVDGSYHHMRGDLDDTETNDQSQNEDNAMRRSTPSRSISELLRHYDDVLAGENDNEKE